MEAWILCGTAIFISLGASYLAIDPAYDDRVIGHAALGAMVLIQGIIVVECLFLRAHYEVLPTTLAMQVAFAVFFVRHIYRFIRWRLSSDCGMRGFLNEE